ncbi:Abscisic acid cluster transcription factor abl7 like protein [Verticillium longisporum]|nr:Abscisic acid cluster transcription factor abl7 like protein [Verticillium longisporum]
MSNEPRESMNCKSCRKRKIKCNRLRPACEACQVFQCPCIYDAVPKKRGPKTDVLEALLKRVDGLEAKKQPLLQDHAAVIPSAARSREVSSPPQLYQAETLDETVRCTAISLSVSCLCSPTPGPGAHEEA